MLKNRTGNTLADTAVVGERTDPKTEAPRIRIARRMQIRCFGMNRLRCLVDASKKSTEKYYFSTPKILVKSSTVFSVGRVGRNGAHLVDEKLVDMHQNCKNVIFQIVYRFRIFLRYENIMNRPGIEPLRLQNGFTL